MNDAFGNIGESFPEKDVKCRVRGCKNIAHISQDQVMRDLMRGRTRDLNLRMCDECLALYNTMEDKEMPCSTPGCEGKWTWTRFSQLEAIRQDFVTTARAKGQSESVIIIRHVLRKSLIPIVTAIGNQFCVLLGGAVQ